MMKYILYTLAFLGGAYLFTFVAILHLAAGNP
jgi:hypothetical protein